MRKLWRGTMIEHHSELYDFGHLKMNPAPTEYIPLWAGGLPEPAFKRAARIADGFIANMQATT